MKTLSTTEILTLYEAHKSDFLPPNYDKYIAFHVTTTILFILLVIFRFIHQYRMRGEGKLVFLIDNVCISVAATIITIWTWSSTKSRISFAKYQYYEQPEPPSWKPEARREKYLHGIAYLVVLWLIRSAFLSMYFRIVPEHQRFLRKFLYFNTAYAAATFCINMGIQILWCLPISSVFRSGEYACYVSLEKEPIIILFISNITSDVCIMAIPLLTLHSLNLTGKREVYALIFVYILGAVSMTASTVRFGFTMSLLSRAQLLTQNFWSITYALNYATPITEIFFGLNMDELIQFWCEMEVFTAAVAVCLPSLRSFLQRRLSTQTLHQDLISSDTDDQDMEAGPRPAPGGMLAQLEQEAQEYDRCKTSPELKGKKAGRSTPGGLLAQLEAEAQEYDRCANSPEPKGRKAGGAAPGGLLAQLEAEAQKYDRIQATGEPEIRPPTPPPKDR